MKIKIPVSQSEIRKKLIEQKFIDTQIEQAFSQAKLSHKNHKARGGEPFLEYHLYPVVNTTLDTIGEVSRGHQLETIAIAFLHDVIEDDPSVNAQFLEKTFTPAIVSGVVYLTRQPGHDELSDEEKLKMSKIYIGNLMNAPRHVRLVKLADRTVNLQNNLRVTHRGDASNLYRIIKETETLFLPLARKTSETYLKEFNQLLAKLKELDRK